MAGYRQITDELIGKENVKIRSMYGQDEIFMKSGDIFLRWD